MLDSIRRKLAELQFSKLIKNIETYSKTSFKLLSSDKETIVLIFPEKKSMEHETNNSLDYFFKTYPKSHFLMIKPLEI